MTESQHVHIVGTGLLGASLGLALRQHGVHITLSDQSPVAAQLAADRGAGVVEASPDAPDLVVVAAPPDVAGQLIAEALTAWPHAVVTDVASVKATVVEDVSRLVPAERERYVPGHPMAGRERSGAVAARSDLFEGCTWVVCPGDAQPRGVKAVESLAASVGARPLLMDAVAHDAAVAAVSHVPQIAASLVASQLVGVDERAVQLSGQGVRDVTRIAASDPLLWTQILSGNARAVLPIVEAMTDELTQVGHALQRVIHSSDVEETPGSSRSGDATASNETDDQVGRGPRAVLAELIANGQEGRARIPGKHGSPATRYGTVAVVVPDEQGSLGRVFTDVGHANVSVEDMRIEHDAAANLGVLELDVLPVSVDRLVTTLTERGWKAHITASF